MSTLASIHRHTRTHAHLLTICISSLQKCTFLKMCLLVHLLRILIFRATMGRDCLTGSLVFTMLVVSFAHP